MVVPEHLQHSFHPPSFVSGPQNPSFPGSHRRHNSEPSITGGAFSLKEHPPNSRRDFSFHPRIGADVRVLAPPAPVTGRVGLKPQYSIRRPRPNTEFFGPEIVLGEPKEHIGHPKTRIGQPVLKLAAIKERMDLLETANGRLMQRIESYRTDTEMLSSSVTYFSSEYYAGLLTIRDLRARSRQDAEIMANQEQQLCQLKKFVGLMVEIGLHEPVLERAHASVLAGKNFELVLVEAIRNAAARPGSAWSAIINAANEPLEDMVQAAPQADAPDVFEERQSTVDDLLKSLKNGEIPSGRHRSSASQRFNKSPARNRSIASKNTLRVKSSKVSLSPRSPVRQALRNIDMNRSPQNRNNNARGTSAHPSKPATLKKSAAPAGENCSDEPPRTNVSAPASEGSEIPFSTQRALASLQRILDNFSNDSIGSLGTTTEGSQTDCYNPQSAAAPSSAAHAISPATIRSASVSSPPRLCVRPPTACSATNNVPAASPIRRARHLTAVPSPVKMSAEGSLVSPSRQRRPISDSGTVARFRKGGWR